MQVQILPLPVECYRLFYALMVKWLSQRTHNPLVVGSNPTGRTYGVVAQLVEQGTFNPKVVGFDSHRPHHGRMAQLVSADALHA